jgi:predicted ABC-type ATPase
MNASAPPRKPTVVVIAGPNGAGKSTAAPFLLKGALGVLEFVNADQIAVGLSAYAPETVSFEAGRIMLRRLHELAQSGSSFAKFLRDCKASGYQVVLFYVTLPTSDLAVQRVALRVKQGGHNIPTDDIHRRFQRSLSNLFKLYLPLSDRWSVLDNAGGRLETIASGTTRRTSVKDSEKWLLLRSIAP